MYPNPSFNISDPVPIQHLLKYYSFFKLKFFNSFLFMVIYFYINFKIGLLAP